MAIPWAGPPASLTKSSECGYLPATVFLWLVRVQRTLGTCLGVSLWGSVCLVSCEDREYISVGGGGSA